MDSIEIVKRTVFPFYKVIIKVLEWTIGGEGSETKMQLSEDKNF